MSERRLEIGAEQTTLGAATLRVGWQSIARGYFRSDPPSPLDLENAIAAIEDEIARARAGVDPGGSVVTSTEAVRDISRAAAGAAPVLAIEAVEQAYLRLAGRAGLPGDAKRAATLLILRELMHHLQIDRILISGTSPAQDKR